MKKKYYKPRISDRLNPAQVNKVHRNRTRRICKELEQKIKDMKEHTCKFGYSEEEGFMPGYMHDSRIKGYETSLEIVKRNSY